MPNFIAKTIKDKPYPFGKDDVNFLWQVDGRNESLIYTISDNESFFIVKKQNQTTKNYVIKGEKLTKPTRIGLLQKALLVYKEQNTSDIISEATAFKPSKVKKNSEFILNIDSFLAEFKALQDKFKKVFIEIGFGSGRHLLFQAQANQDTLVIGIEVYKPSIEQVSKLAVAQNLQNVRVINTDARLLLSLIDSNLIDKIFLHFPVPWDKAEHRRVVSKEFANECQRTLKENAKFELRTDSREYCDFTTGVFLNLESPLIQIKKNEELQVSSKYEDRWKKQQKDIYDMIYTCKIESEAKDKIKEFEFKNNYDLVAILSNFKNTTIKEDDFFVHFEEIYKSMDTLVIKVAFGAFSRPEHCFLRLKDGRCEYFIKKPLLTKENLKAHNALEEFLSKCKI